METLDLLFVDVFELKVLLAKIDLRLKSIQELRTNMSVYKSFELWYKIQITVDDFNKHLYIEGAELRKVN